MATLIARISDGMSYQYDEITNTVTYQNDNPKLHNILTPNGNCVFFCPGFILLGEFQNETDQIVRFHNISKIDISKKDLRRLNAFNPEENSRTMGAFFAYIQSNPIDIKLLYQQFASKPKQLISYWIIKDNSIKQLLGGLKENDRVITIDSNNKIVELFTVQNGNLTVFNPGNNLFNARGKTLNEILHLIERVKSSNSNLGKCVNRIKRTLESSNSFAFESFSEYYNIIHNKNLYSKDLPKDQVIEDEKDNDCSNDSSVNMALNSIFYGPPGTGKTYISVERALEIINGEIELERTENKQEFSKLQKEGRIFFTTFHQNMSYEDFIEGIKPMEPKEDDESLKYEIQDGLFMKACIEATYDFIKNNFPQNKQENQIRTFNQLYNLLFQRVEQEQKGEIKLPTLNRGNVLVSVSDQGNFSVKHDNGIRNYTVSRNRLEQLFNAFSDLNAVKNIVVEFRAVIGGCNATAYWAVLNEIIRLQQVDNNDVQEDTLSYEDKKNIVTSFWKNTDYTPVDEDSSNSFVFIIDEINRGNIAQIFGELITLVEEDKRLGKKEEIRLELPYSKQTFCVPPNLYIIGTMNTADRSVEALDTALRRRFSFVPMMPEYEGLNKACEGVNLQLLLKKLNDRLTVLKDRDHTIGHAWLWDITTIDGLKLAFKDKIIPLLQEFFYNDYEKLGLLLGDQFIEEELNANANLFATFNGGAGMSNQYINKKVYRLKHSDDWSVVAFKSIYE